MLDATELQSSTWLKVEQYLSDRIDSLRLSLESDLDPVATTLVRGRIRELKVLLDRSKGDQAIVGHDE